MITQTCCGKGHREQVKPTYVVPCPGTVVTPCINMSKGRRLLLQARKSHDPDSYRWATLLLLPKQCQGTLVVNLHLSRRLGHHPWWSTRHTSVSLHLPMQSPAWRGRLPSHSEVVLQSKAGQLSPRFRYKIILLLSKGEKLSTFLSQSFIFLSLLSSVKAKSRKARRKNQVKK